MLRNRRSVLVFGLLLVLSGLAALTWAADPPYITAALQSTARTLPQVARDADCKPAEVLAFAGIKPGDKVALMLPSDYYTRIISKTVGVQGKLYAMEPAHGANNVNQVNAAVEKAKAEGKTFPPSMVFNEVLPLQHTTDFRNMMFIYVNWMNFGGIFPVPEQLDVVFTSQAYHELHNKVEGPSNNAPLDMVAVNKAIFRTMKPGGIYVVSDYAAAKGAGFGQTQELGRSEADAVKAEVLAAGFVFDGESKILASPGDDLSKPSAGDKADQFILRFKKPADASPATKRQPMSVMKNYFGNTYVSGTPEARQFVMFYHEDGTYQEPMGSTGIVQLERYYFDADGYNCSYHEFPQEGAVTCHVFDEDYLKAKVGDTWLTNKRPRALVKGYQYPNVKAGKGGE